MIFSRLGPSFGDTSPRAYAATAKQTSAWRGSHVCIDLLLQLLSRSSVASTPSSTSRSRLVVSKTRAFVNKPGDTHV